MSHPIEAVRKPGRPLATTDSIRAPELIAKRVKKLAQMRNINVSEYVEPILAPQVEKDWADLPKAVREYLEAHMDD